MATVAVRKREGYLAVASSAPLALHYLGHPHDVLPFCRDEYLWMADLALEPPCVYPVGVFNVVNEVALCGYYDVKVQGGASLHLWGQATIWALSCSFLLSAPSQ